MDTVLQVHRDRPEGSAASRRCGGNRLTGGAYDKGYFVEPTVFADVTEEHDASRRKRSSGRCWPSCAPRISKTPCASPTTSRSASRRPSRPPISRAPSSTSTGMEAGLLTVNLPSAGVEYQLPFGGTKESSFGPKEQGPAALEFYSDYKTVYLKY